MNEQSEGRPVRAVASGAGAPPRETDRRRFLRGVAAG